MNKKYRVEEIIFALRKEYLEVERQLEELKKYVIASNNLEKFNFYLYNYDICRVHLALTERRNWINKMCIRLGIYAWGAVIEDVSEDIEKRYYSDKKRLCTISNPEELKRKIKRIQESDFAKNIIANKPHPIPIIEDKDKSFFIKEKRIDLYTRAPNKYQTYSYYSNYDLIIVENEFANITEEDIYSILNLTIDGSYLNDYHRNILDNYEKKEIEIENIPDEKRAKFKIIEEPKKLILRPKK